MTPTEPSRLELVQQLPSERLPGHIAFIMDGNGRWAQLQGSPRMEGHSRGVDSVRNVVTAAVGVGLAQVTLYCFSSENWKRPQVELDFLMYLLKHFLIEERPLIMNNKLKFKVIGRVHELDEEVIREIEKTQELTRDHQGMMLCLAINYGSRLEIVDAVRGIIAAVQAGNINVDKIDEQVINQHLYTANMPDPDLIVRTAGEMRLSNFLLWQMSYAEFYVTEKFWPDFGAEELYTAILDYASRDRRFGGLKS